MIEVWGEDEARLGLKPILRRVWAPRGERPRSLHHPRYEWLWVFAAVHPRTGRVFWLVLPHLAAEMMQLFLDAFAREHATPGKRVVLVVDGASAHRAKSLRVPERVTLVSLPAYTPELNPTERLWPLVKEGVANRTHESLASLEEAVCGRCQRITTEQVSALTNYHWWPVA
jgi:transposase